MYTDCSCKSALKLTTTSIWLSISLCSGTVISSSRLCWEHYVYNTHGSMLSLRCGLVCSGRAKLLINRIKRMLIHDFMTARHTARAENERSAWPKGVIHWGSIYVRMRVHKSSLSGRVAAPASASASRQSVLWPQTLAQKEEKTREIKLYNYRLLINSWP